MLAAAAVAIPSALQLLLVRAAVLPGARALDAWREWQRGARIESLEPDSQWLLPLLYANLRRAGVPEPPLQRYANVYRHNWYKNQLLLRVAGRVLRSVGAPALLLGDAPLAAGYYPLLGARPIENLILFCADLAGPAQCLEDAGWRRLADRSSGSLAFVDALDRRVELCVAVIDAEQGARLLARGRPLRLGGVNVRVLSALDQLALVLAQRDAWDCRSRLLWVADSAQILGKDQAIGADMVLGRARALGLEPAVAEGWRLLRDVYAVVGAE